ncbi:alanine racemase [Shouchella lonarensis]|uniref:Alanine racemase n=1 Tax=Shouchella lonarensis TaxID=1464122 RepID=A0A1G6MYK7_9BACI|nr:alanine racemase [Shouchella lonarensis]SDC60324.1 alanine racemase [Shouchella lonarensis]
MLGEKIVKKKPLYYRDTWIEVDLDAIATNVRSLLSLYKQQSRPVKVMAVVKANGYGHGAFAVAKTALEAGATHVAVALLDEALSLREQGIEAPIFVMGKIRAEDVCIAREHRIAVTVCEREWLREAEQYMDGEDPVEPLRMHVKVDTGMGRLGVRTSQEMIAIMEDIQHAEGMMLEGVFTHFATADEQDTRYFQLQMQRFRTFLAQMQKAGLSVPYVHCGNSAAALRFPDDMFSMVRFGIAMYGLVPSPEMKDELPFQLNPALSLKAKLSFVKEITAGEAVSYGATYRATEKTIVGTVPIGYGDGWLRNNSVDGSYVLVDGKEAPFLGRICMDQCMVSLPYRMSVGTEVTLIGGSKEAYISMDEVAKRLGTINYEVPCLLGARIPRIYLKGGDVLS